MACALLFIFAKTQTAKAATGKTIPDGVSIGNVDVSGMTKEEATSAVESYVNSLLNAQITLKGKDDTQTLTLSAAELGISWDNDEVIDDAVNLGQKGNVVQRYKDLKDAANVGKVLDLGYTVNEETLKTVLENNCASFNQEAVNYQLSHENGSFSVIGGTTGYIIDEDASVTAIEDYIKNTWNKSDATIDLVMTEDEPEGNKDDLAKVKDVLGTFTTSYTTSGSSRCSNIENGCKLASGKTIYPGEEYSVLDNITPFTEENGYYLAGSYLQGTVVESFGGGICQVSTTLYNAVLLAELEVTERHNHSMIISYVDPSADAAIAENGGKNFKFVNSTDYPIYIEGYTSNKHITFTIYGVETRDSNRKVSYESETLETTNPEGDSFVKDATQAVGYIHVQAAHQGIKAQLVKKVTVNGVEESEEVVNSSTYQMVPRTISVGTSGADANVMAQIDVAIATADLNTVKSIVAALQAQIAAGGPTDASSVAAAAGISTDAGAAASATDPNAAVVADSDEAAAAAAAAAAGADATPAQ